MQTSIRSIPTLLLLALLLGSVAATAQQTDDERVNAYRLVEQYQSVQARLMLAFWTPRLNEYRQRIDRMLSASDLVEVNELRARKAVLLERMKAFAAQQQEEHRRAYYSGSSEGAGPGGINDTAVMIATTNSDVDTTSDRTVLYDEDGDRIYTDAEYEQMEREYSRRMDSLRLEQERRHVEWVRSERELLGRILRGDERAIGELGDESRLYGENTESYRRMTEGRPNISASEALDTREEKEELTHVANWITRKYRTGMDELSALYIADVARYRDTLRMATLDFLNRHRAEIRESELLMDVLGSSLENSIEDLSRYAPRSWFPAGLPNSRNQLEAALVTYNGQDLQDLAGVENLLLVSSPGLDKLPASVTLGPSTESSESATTRVPYTLAEPATKVILELLDMRGVTVATFDQGARDAGSHTVAIDSTTLLPGTYIYQLRVISPTRESLHSRTLTVGK